MSASAQVTHVHRTTDEYMALPYTIVLKKDDDGDVVAKITELEGCIAHGPDEAEALRCLREVQRVWIESCLESGQQIPEPDPEEVLPSGKWVQRVPRSLHLKLTQLAKKEEVSLNQLVTSILSAATVPQPLHKTIIGGGAGAVSWTLGSSDYRHHWTNLFSAASPTLIPAGPTGMMIEELCRASALMQFPAEHRTTASLEIGTSYAKT